MAATIPPFDLIVGGKGYVFAEMETTKARFSSSPTFVDRQNTQGNYGDNQQDFWLTLTQKDFSLGEGQKYYRGNDEDRARRFYRGKNLDLTIPGEVTIRPDKTDLTFAANPKCVTGVPGSNLIWAATSTNLYTVDNVGTIADKGAHGVGVTPARFGLANDLLNVYISGSGIGSTVRRYNPLTSAFSTFSNTGADSLAYLNNTLYGYSKFTGVLYQYDSAGGTVAVYTWKTATAAAITGQEAQILPFGGKLLILRYRTQTPGGAELWISDTAGPALVAELPANFNAYEACIVDSSVYIAGAYENIPGFMRPAVLFYRDGSQGELWRADQDAAGTDYYASVSRYDNGLLIADPVGAGPSAISRLVYYDSDKGSFSTVLESAVVDKLSLLATAGNFTVLVKNSSSGTAGTLWPQTTTASTATIDSSIIDFDSSLPKIIRSIRVMFQSGGGTSSVDLSYSLDGGNFTSLATNVTSGVEYGFPAPSEGVTYQTVQYRITLNKGSGSSPKLQRVIVKGIPAQAAFKKRQYVLYLGGKDGKSPVILRDGSPHPKDGLEMFNDLQTTMALTAPQTFQDHSGTFTGIFERDKCEFQEFKPEVFIALLTVREV